MNRKQQIASQDHIKTFFEMIVENDDTKMCYKLTVQHIYENKMDV